MIPDDVREARDQAYYRELSNDRNNIEKTKGYRELVAQTDKCVEAGGNFSVSILAVKPINLLILQTCFTKAKHTYF